jgi:Pyruvate/2-oxoacid:ferredoxin oxidoreductase delta subunit
LALSTQGRDIYLDDTPCANCPLGQVQPVLVQTGAEANGWATLNPDMTPLILRSEQIELPSKVQRSIYDADRPPLSRRGFFSALKQLGAEAVASKERGELIKTGKAVPVSERLPQVAPQQRAKILDLLEKYAQPAADFGHRLNSSSPPVVLPLADITLETTRCTACGMCARFCPTGALKFLSDNQAFALTFQSSLCLGETCNICQMACPEQTITTQPIAISPNIFIKKPLAAGELIPCQKCRQPTANGPDSPATCFTCRQSGALNDLFKALPFHSPLMDS